MVLQFFFSKLIQINRFSFTGPSQLPNRFGYNKPETKKKLKLHRFLGEGPYKEQYPQVPVYHSSFVTYVKNHESNGIAVVEAFSITNNCCSCLSIVHVYLLFMFIYLVAFSVNSYQNIKLRRSINNSMQI